MRRSISYTIEEKAEFHTREMEDLTYEEGRIYFLYINLYDMSICAEAVRAEDFEEEGIDALTGYQNGDLIIRMDVHGTVTENIVFKAIEMGNVIGIMAEERCEEYDWIQRLQDSGKADEAFNSSLRTIAMGY